MTDLTGLTDHDALVTFAREMAHSGIASVETRAREVLTYVEEPFDADDDVDEDTINREQGDNYTGPTFREED